MELIEVIPTVFAQISVDTLLYWVGGILLGLACLFVVALLGLFGVISAWGGYRMGRKPKTDEKPARTPNRANTVFIIAIAVLLIPIVGIGGCTAAYILALRKSFSRQLENSAQQERAIEFVAGMGGHVDREYLAGPDLLPGGWHWRVHLDDTELTDTQLATLVPILKPCPVKELNIRNTKVSNDGLAVLAELDSLSVLDVTGTEITKPFWRQLQDALPQLQVVKDENSLLTLNHGASVAALAFSPDGKTLVSAGGVRRPFDGPTISGEAVIFWDVSTGRKQSSYEMHSASSLAFSPDGATLAIDGAGLGLWDVATGKRIREISTEGSPNMLQFSPDGRWLAAGGNGGTIFVSRVDTGEPQARIQAHATCLTFTRDSNSLITGGRESLSVYGNDDDGIKQWDVATGRLLGVLKPTERICGSGVEFMEFSPDARTLASSCDNRGQMVDTPIKLWDLETGELRISLAVHGKKQTHTVAFSPDGHHLASVDLDKTIKLWDLATGKELASWQVLPTNMTEAIDCLVFSPDSKLLASAGSDGTIKLWDLTAVIAGDQGGVKSTESVAEPASR